jgi:hypothetical protein
MGNWGNYGILWDNVDETQNFKREVTMVVYGDNNKKTSEKICDISYTKPREERKPEQAMRQRQTDHGPETVLCEKRSQIVDVKWPNMKPQRWKLSIYWYKGYRNLVQTEPPMWLKDATFEPEDADFGVQVAVPAQQPHRKGVFTHAHYQLRLMRACLDAQEALFQGICPVD